MRLEALEAKAELSGTLRTLFHFLLLATRCIEIIANIEHDLYYFMCLYIDEYWSL